MQDSSFVQFLWNKVVVGVKAIREKLVNCLKFFVLVSVIWLNIQAFLRILNNILTSFSFLIKNDEIRNCNLQLGKFRPWILCVFLWKLSCRMLANCRSCNSRFWLLHDRWFLSFMAWNKALPVFEDLSQMTPTKCSANHQNVTCKQNWRIFCQIYQQKSICNIVFFIAKL